MKTSQWIRVLYYASVAMLNVMLLIACVVLVRRMGRPDYGQLIAFDPNREGGHLLPNLNCLAKGDRHARPIRFITNSRGFRSQGEFDHTPPAGVFRILLLGDSYIDGMRTDQADTIGAVLARNLNTSDAASPTDRVEVMIAGHNNPVSARYYYQRHGWLYQPDLVIVGVTLGNDLTWNARGVTFEPGEMRDGIQQLVWNGSQRQDEQKAPGLVIPAAGYADGETGWTRGLMVWRRLSSRYFGTAGSACCLSVA